MLGFMSKIVNNSFKHTHISVLSDSRMSRLNNSNSISDPRKPSHIRTQSALTVL